MTLMDRKRDKLKLSVDWMPTEELSLQFMVEDGKDKYTAPTEKGLRDTGMSILRHRCRSDPVREHGS